MANTFLNAVFDGSNTAASTAMNVYTAGSNVTATVVIGLTLANTSSSQITADIILNAVFLTLSSNASIPRLSFVFLNKLCISSLILDD